MVGARMSAPDLRYIGALIVTLGIVMVARSIPLPRATTTALPIRRRRFQWHRPITLRWGYRTKEPRLHPLARYNVSLDLSVRPSVHLRGETLHELSVVVSNSGVNLALHSALVRCISGGSISVDGSGGDMDAWGMFNAEQFAAGRVQLEYYASVPVGIARQWRREVDQYMRDSELFNSCVRRLVPGFPAGANIAYASRVAIARRMKKGLFGEELWVAFAIAAMSGVVLVEVAVLLWLRARRKRILMAMSMLRDTNIETRTADMEEGTQACALANADSNHRQHHQLQHEHVHQHVSLFQLDMRNNNDK